jgi:hypothetical protein
VSAYICESCLSIEQPQRELRGSFAIEFILWLLLILPGLAYALWRRRGQYLVCRTCGSDRVLEQDSPQGRNLLASLPYLPIGNTPLQKARRLVKLIPLAAGVSVVGLGAIAIFFPGTRDTAWLRVAVGVAGALILAHPLWAALHLAERATALDLERPKGRVPMSPSMSERAVEQPDAADEARASSAGRRGPRS